MSRSLIPLRLRCHAAGRPGGKGQSPVVPRGFEKSQEVDPAWPPVQFSQLPLARLQVRADSSPLRPEDAIVECLGGRRQVGSGRADQSWITAVGTAGIEDVTAVPIVAVGPSENFEQVGVVELPFVAGPAGLGTVALRAPRNRRGSSEYLTPTWRHEDQPGGRAFLTSHGGQHRKCRARRAAKGRI
jgi:hypothetical protein